MLGAICGDIVGSRHEFNAIKTTEFELFHEDCRPTDDTVLSFAVLQSLLETKSVEDCLVDWTLSYLDAGYGLHFLEWVLKPDRGPYGSLGNGSAMRVAPVGWLGGDSLVEVAARAAMTAEPTHGHHHGIRAAKAVAVAVRMALEGWAKEEIAAVLTDRFGYDLARRTDDIRPRYRFEVAAHRSVPEALICLLEADSWEGAVRLAVTSSPA